MEKVRKTYYKNKEILIVDYSDCRGEEMISVFEKAKQLGLNEKKQFLVLSIFNDKTTVSANFMRHVEKEVLNVDEFIVKQAIIGLSQIQEWILKGMNLWYKRQIFSFDSMDNALEFLVMEENSQEQKN